MKKKSYKALRQVRHDGVKHDAGATIELATEAAETLVNLGAVILCDETEPPQINTITGDGSGHTLPPADGTEKNDTLETTQIVDAFKHKFAGDAPDKKPNLDDVRKWCENPAITKEQRDEAWELYVASQDDEGKEDSE